MFAADIPTGLLRFKNKRTTTAYLTSKTAGSAVGASKTTADWSQIWLVSASGDGFTIRNAKTAEYLQANFAVPAAGKATLYIQYDKNQTTCLNISSNSDFSGSTCLNLGNNGTQITKWNCSNDTGSMWIAEAVTDVAEADVRQHFKELSGFTDEVNEGKYYRIISSYGLAMQDTEAVGGDISAQEVSASNIAQYWTLIKDGNNWRIQNVLTERYLLSQTTQSAAFHTATAANVAQFSLNVTFAVTPVSGSDDPKWTIATPGNSRGLHDASSQGHNVVLWSTNAEASQWSFQEAEVSQEAIDAAREKLNEWDNIVAEFNAIKSKKSTLQTALNALFEDKACTTLKAEIAALSDDDLEANESYATLTDDMKAMVKKVKNDTWQQYTDGDYTADYERFFRIADYKVYSHYQNMMNSDNFTMSNSFGKLSGPTGIVANKGDIIYIYVDKTANSRCTLQLEAVSTDGVPGNHTTGSTTSLSQGLNLFQFSEQKMLYIFYQLNTTPKDSKIYSKLSRYDDIKIHIEGGQLNGYWDATRGMTNADWKLLQKDLLKASPVLNLKTEHLVFCMDADLVKTNEPNEMEGLMRIWEQIPVNEERYMGVEDFEGSYRNIWNVFSIDYNYMFATTYGTYYNNSTLPTIMNYNNMRQPGALWGPSHEMGHNHQASINVVGTTESSNNLFSNINTFEQGIQTTRCFLPSDNFDALAKGVTWVKRDIWNTTRMFFQLYLYFHGMHHDDNFLPNLFRKMRKNPITKNSGWDSTTEYTYTEDGQTKTGTGANTTYGRLDYLHLAKMICDVAEADLSEFFESYGMFVPADKVFVGDYANYLVTTTQADIDAAKAYMQKYPKKLGNIMFMDDHILPMKAADPDNKFEGKPASDGKRVNNIGQHDSNLPIGDFGDYELFDGHEEYDVTGDYFQISSGTITFKGEGAVGHKIYDSNGKLVWATNAKSATIPSALSDFKNNPTKYVCVAAQANMTDVPCPYYHLTKSKKYHADVYFGKEEDSREWVTNASTDLTKYLPENAVVVMQKKANVTIPDAILAQTNVVENTSTDTEESYSAKSLVINGDQPWYLPNDVNAESVAFAKENSGYAALDLPFAVTNTDIEGLQTASVTAADGLVITNAEVVEAGQPVVVNGNVNLTLSNVALKAANKQAQENINVLSADGTATDVVETATPFIYAFDIATAVHSLDADKAAGVAGAKDIFDLTGRRVQNLTKGGVYIIDGKKVMIK